MVGGLKLVRRTLLSSQTLPHYLFNPSVTLGTDPASFHFGKGGLTSRAKNNKGNELQHANASMKNAYKSASIT